MAEEPKIYSTMDFEDSESETFLPKPISFVIGRRGYVFNKFALLGWVLAILLCAFNLCMWIFPKNPTDMECTRQLNTWCKLKKDEKS